MRRNKAYLKTHKCQSLGHAAHGRYGTPFASKLRYLTEVTNLTMSFFANQKCRDINKASWIGSRISLHDADMYYLLNKGILLAIMPHFKKRGFPMEDWCTKRTGPMYRDFLSKTYRIFKIFQQNVLKFSPSISVWMIHITERYRCVT